MKENIVVLLKFFCYNLSKGLRLLQILATWNFSTILKTHAYRATGLGTIDYPHTHSNSPEGYVIEALHCNLLLPFGDG